MCQISRPRPISPAFRLTTGCSGPQGTLVIPSPRTPKATTHPARSQAKVDPTQALFFSTSVISLTLTQQLDFRSEYPAASRSLEENVFRPGRKAFETRPDSNQGPFGSILVRTTSLLVPYPYVFIHRAALASSLVVRSPPDDAPPSPKCLDNLRLFYRLPLLPGEQVFSKVYSSPL